MFTMKNAAQIGQEPATCVAMFAAHGAICLRNGRIVRSSLNANIRNNIAVSFCLSVKYSFICEATSSLDNNLPSMSMHGGESQSWFNRTWKSFQMFPPVFGAATTWVYSLICQLMSLAHDHSRQCLRQCSKVGLLPLCALFLARCSFFTVGMMKHGNSMDTR